ncbi:hypothetical protein D3C80_1715420 [compost metagenome]
MEQRGIGEDAVEIPLGQLQFEEVLLPNFAADIGAGHGDEACAAIQSDRFMPQ